MSKKANEPRASREHAGHTQRTAAALVGVHWRTWQNWETGVRAIPAQTLRVYRHLAGVEPMPYTHLGPADGLRKAQALLGHTSPGMTRRYVDAIKKGRK